MRVVPNERYVVSKKNFLKNPWVDCYCGLNSCFLFRLHEKGRDKEMNFDITIQMKLEHVLAQRLNESTTWKYMYKYVCINTVKLRKL